MATQILTHPARLAQQPTLSAIAADPALTMDALLLLRHRWPANLLSIVRGEADWPDEIEVEDDSLQPITESLEQILNHICGIETDFGGRFSESTSELLEWLAVELDHRLKTGYWSREVA